MSEYYEKLDKAKAEFLRDAGQHQMIVERDDGTFRHIRFAKDGSSVYHFDITTWPGYLCISGDMGCFVFARTTDMFQFFRGDRINPQYWAEKIQATGKRNGHEAFSFDLLKEAVAADFENWDFDNDEQKAEAWTAIVGDDYSGLFYDAEGSDMQHAVSEVMDYVCPFTNQKFKDFWEHNLHDYTYHFMWCCNAIQWAIQQYDAKAAAPPPQPREDASHPPQQEPARLREALEEQPKVMHMLNAAALNQSSVDLSPEQAQFMLAELNRVRAIARAALAEDVL